MDAARRAYQLVNGVLVESTVGEVRPTVEKNRVGLAELVVRLHGGLCLERANERGPCLRSLSLGHLQLRRRSDRLQRVPLLRRLRLERSGLRAAALLGRARGRRRLCALGLSRRRHSRLCDFCAASGPRVRSGRFRRCRARSQRQRSLLPRLRALCGCACVAANGQRAHGGLGVGQVRRAAIWRSSSGA
jgi:hypothetical protein